MKQYYPLKYQRNEYAKKIRKAYEAHKISARRCDLREVTIRKDNFCNTISTVAKDYAYILEVRDDK